MQQSRTFLFVHGVPFSTQMKGISHFALRTKCIYIPSPNVSGHGCLDLRTSTGTLHMRNFMPQHPFEPPYIVMKWNIFLLLTLFICSGDQEFTLKFFIPWRDLLVRKRPYHKVAHREGMRKLGGVEIFHENAAYRVCLIPDAVERLNPQKHRTVQIYTELIPHAHFTQLHFLTRAWLLKN